jgi:circadian clock protein KaiC
MALDLLTTGVPALDQALGGGLHPRQLVLLCGAPGSGKTALAAQVAFAHASAGRPVVFATTGGESHGKLLDSLGGFRFFQKERVGNELYIVSAQPWVKKGVKELREVLVLSARERKARLLVLDGLSAVREAWKDDHLLRELLHELGAGLSQHECAAVVTSADPWSAAMGRPEAAAADGVIALGASVADGRRVRRLEVAKLTGRTALDGEHPLAIDGGGVRLWTRLEVTPPPARSAAPDAGRVSLGVAELDRLLGGGLPPGRPALLLGLPGTGKSALAAHFAAATPDPCAYLALRDPPEAVADRVRAFGLQAALERIAVRAPGRIEAEADEVAHLLLETIDGRGARRAVVDGLPELERLVPDGRRPRFLAALGEQLRARGVTALLLCDGGESLAEGPRGALADSILLMRHAGVDGRVARLVTVPKLSGRHEPRVRELRISERGFSVREPIGYADVSGGGGGSGSQR